MLADPQRIRQPFQRMAVGGPLLFQDVRMDSAQDHIDDIRMFGDDLGQRLDRYFDAFARREQAERQQDGMAFQAELVFIVRRIHERQVRDAVRDERDFGLGDIVNALEKLNGQTAHNHQPVAQLRQFGDDRRLSWTRFGQHRMQRHDHGHAQPAHEIQHVLAVRAAIDAVLVLDQGHVHLIDIEQVGGGAIIAP